MEQMQQYDTEILNMKGQWSYALDPQDIGESERWYQSQIAGQEDVVTLPGTLTLNGVGDVQEWSEEMNRESVRSLRQRHSYIGAAWYEYETEVSAEWIGKRFEIFLERVMFQSTLWVNGQFAGCQDSLSIPHTYDATAFIKTGEKNRFTIRIDNRDIQNLGSYPSAYTEETQSIWNGIIGRIELQALEQIWLSNLQIFPDPKQRTVKLLGTYYNTSSMEARAEINISARIKHGQTRHEAPTISKNLVIAASSSKTFEWMYEMGDGALLWDEFLPNIYEMRLENRFILGDVQVDSTETQTFGLRSFQNNGRILEVNGRPIFLRGTLECCIFPLTGHPPMELDAWLNLFGTARDYGLNHIRFHSWCPPKAAFEAADQLGIYVQVESPIWMDTWNLPVGTHPEHYTYLPEEARRILDAYGNHPSFCIYSNGNELNGDFNLLHQMVAELKENDNRRLYTLTTNWDRPLDPEDDLFCSQTVDGVGARGQYFPEQLSDTTQLDFRVAVSKRPVPVVTHEVGQYTVYPDVEEIDSYSGALRPVNLEVIRADLKKRGLLGDIRKFVHGSGMLALQLYRDEIEAALRTPELGGFQLLDLHDFPGQSTATVGILNAFWESKGLIEPQQFREFCAPTVLLLRMSKRIYTTEDTFHAEVTITNYGASELPASNVKWTIADGEGRVLDSGLLQSAIITFGADIPIGQFISDVLKTIIQSDRLTILLEWIGSDIRSEWPIWVYASTAELQVTEANILVTSHLDGETERMLAEGQNVLFLASGAGLEHAAPGKFYPVFWSPVHFATENPCGIVVNYKHPALTGFPTLSYAEHQWKDLLDRSVSLAINDELPFNPIVQVIPNFYHNRKLTNLTEYRVGKGKLIICGINIEEDLANRPAAAQLRSSLIAYIARDDFAPEVTLDMKGLRKLLKKKEPHEGDGANQAIAGRELGIGKPASSDSVKDDNHAPFKGNDGIGHTLWLASDDSVGHWWQVDLIEARAIIGTKVKFHQEGNFLYVIQVSTDGIDWSVAANQTGQTSTEQTRIDHFAANGRYVRIVYNGLPANVHAGHFTFEVYGN
ncbi:sugar-binding domain-containing protein [Paenibacillus luteus]|uniref:sugar-binding domain-containing protein n=1 Tax=Paenibacillus luteus TaxID=2545753 RepID=UPI001143677C|nr:sugar-binding domain-containing protein [Paenibacillus luteus]